MQNEENRAELPAGRKPLKLVLVLFVFPKWEKALNLPTGEGDRVADENAE